MYKQRFLIEYFIRCNPDLEKFAFHGRYLRYLLPFALKLTEPMVEIVSSHKVYELLGLNLTKPTRKTYSCLFET